MTRSSGLLNNPGRMDAWEFGAHPTLAVLRKKLPRLPQPSIATSWKVRS